MAGPFKMRGFSGFGNSPMKQVGLQQSLVEKGKKREAVMMTDREARIARNKEFNAYAVEQGWKPPQPGDNATDKEVEDYHNFYKNKDNVNFLNKKQAEYFKNK